MKITIIGSIIVTVIVIMLFAITGALMKMIIKSTEGCKQFELIDKFEENPTAGGFLIYYSDGRITEERWLPRCIKLSK
jgi:hypothetical protein